MKKLVALLIIAISVAGCASSAPRNYNGDGQSSNRGCDQTTGTVVGGLAGALLGSRFGKGHGQDAATVVGAVGGAVAGQKICE